MYLFIYSCIMYLFLQIIVLNMYLVQKKLDDSEIVQYYGHWVKFNYISHTVIQLP